MPRIAPWLLFALTLSAAASAEVYRIVDEDGNVTFTDQPRPGAERLRVAPVPTYRAPKLPSPTGAEDTPVETVKYQSVRIAQPEDDLAIRDNAGNVTVSVTTDPALVTAQGHRIQLYLDGEKQGKPTTSTMFTFSNLDRGTHTLVAAVVDDKGKELARSQPSTFHLLRAAVGGPPRPSPR
jgi:hypothetical protein